MASISQLCRDDRLTRRADLVVRPLPEIGLCMIYRPKPAKMITLNASSWLLFEACGGESVDEIVTEVLRVQQGSKRPLHHAQALQGLQELFDLDVLNRTEYRLPIEGASP